MILVFDFGFRTDSTSGQERDVAEIIPHENYKRHNVVVYNDIALIKVQTPFIMGEKVGIACLPAQGDSLPTAPDAECYLTGMVFAHHSLPNENVRQNMKIFKLFRAKASVK